jgi:hypothetical protein
VKKTKIQDENSPTREEKRNPPPVFSVYIYISICIVGGHGADFFVVWISFCDPTRNASIYLYMYVCMYVCICFSFYVNWFLAMASVTMSLVLAAQRGGNWKPSYRGKSYVLQAKERDKGFYLLGRELDGTTILSLHAGFHAVYELGQGPYTYIHTPKYDGKQGMMSFLLCNLQNLQKQEKFPGFHSTGDRL